MPGSIRGRSSHTCSCTRAFRTSCSTCSCCSSSARRSKTAWVVASDGLAHLAHLGGVGTALLYLRGQAWWVARGERRGRGPPPESSVLVSQPPRVSRGSSIPASAQRGKSRGVGEPDARANAEIDRVLDKIIATGVESLTPAERKFLTEISRRLRTPPPKA